MSSDPDVVLRELNGERSIELNCLRCARVRSRGAIVGRQPDNTSIAGSTAVQLHFDVLSTLAVSVSNGLSK